MIKWFSIYWWKYLTEKRRDGDESWIAVIKCRLTNHPKGVVWFNYTGFEPDMHCRDCGDDLG